MATSGVTTRADSASEASTRFMSCAKVQNVMQIENFDPTTQT